MTLTNSTERRLARLESQISTDDVPIEIMLQIVKPGPNGGVKVGTPFSYNDVPKRIPIK